MRLAETVKGNGLNKKTSVVEACLLYFNLFLMLIEEVKLDQMIIIIWKDVYFSFKLLIPFVFNGVEEPTFSKVRMYNRIYKQR